MTWGALAPLREVKYRHMSASRANPVLRWIGASPDADRILTLPIAMQPFLTEPIHAMSTMPSATAILLQRYHASLPVKHAELSTLWQAVRDEPTDADALHSLQRALHRLAGSAGAYGYVALGDLARDADALIILRVDPLAAGQTNADFVERLRAPLDRLLAELVAAF